MAAVLAVLSTGRVLGVPDLDLVGSCPGALRGRLNATVVQSNLAYLATTKGLIIADVSDPSLVRRIGELAITNRADSVNALAVAGTFACLAVDDGVMTVDVSDPARPAVLGYLSFATNHPIALELRSNLVFAASSYPDGQGGQRGELLVIDVSSRTAPALVARSSGLANPATDVGVSGAFAYLAHHTYGEGSGVEVINVGDPLAPQRVGSWTYPGYTGTGTRLCVSGSRLYVTAAEQGLYVLDVSNPSVPTEIGHISLTAPFDVQVNGATALVADHVAGLTVLDVSTPSNLRILGQVSPTTYFVRVSANGSRAFLADLYGGLRIVDFSTPSAPRQVGTWVTSGETRDIQVQDGFAYVADGWAGLEVFDVRNPASPRSAQRFPFWEVSPQSDLVGLSVTRSNAFLIGGRNGGSHVISLQNGTNLALFASVPNDGYWLTGSGNDLVVNGSYAYVGKGYCSGWQGIKVLDLRDPKTPVIVGESPPTTSWVYRMATAGNYVYALFLEGGLQIFDVRNPTQPMPLGNVPLPALPGDGKDVLVRGRYAYCALSQHGTQIVDVSDPDAPVISGLLNTDAEGLYAQGQFLFVAGRRTQVFDLANPVAPQLVAESALSSRAVTADDQFIYLADGQGGLKVFRNSWAPLTLRGPQLTDGQFVFQISPFQPGGSCRIEVSSDARSWALWKQMQANGREITATDVVNTATSPRFYRAGR